MASLTAKIKVEEERRRSLPAQPFATTRTSLFLSWLTLEILDQVLPQRVYRSNPIVVKKPVSKFRSKKVEHRVLGQ